ncbi:winged helix-turn-helix transcriptional regulator [Halosolutus amylolyticus]|uniref:Winged helix-turn-helix transcriptional regulator n=1 Tax=Halosolutus amylolyticus TaxID=2932267 RepID=A0ABD5PVI0_9EURY|nr:winged helix-turn-helix transcriptional regulator [Halosolutus amylolyticus]
MVDQEPGIPNDARIALDVLSLLSKKWHPIVIVTLDRRGPLGFNELLESIPNLSGKVLTETLEALSETDVVDRTVVSESPLRVEYDLTEAGRDMRPIFDALAEWGTRHLEASPPTILIADADRRLTELYGQWLPDRYAVARAHNDCELRSALDDDPDVLLLEKSLPGVDCEAVVEYVAESCRTIVLVGDRPGVDLLELSCDDVLQKPIVRETAIDAIDEQLSRRGEPADDRERAALAARRSLLESVHSRERLEADPRYREARSEGESFNPSRDG